MPPDQGQRRSGVLSDCSANRRVPARSLAIVSKLNQADRRLMTPPDPCERLGREVIEDADALRDIGVFATLLGTSAYVRDLRFLSANGPGPPDSGGFQYWSSTDRALRTHVKERKEAWAAASSHEGGPYASLPAPALPLSPLESLRSVRCSGFGLATA